MSERLDVLVAGAGPTGLALACDLRRRGLQVRIVDAAEGPFGGSRAKGLQPRSLEVFHDLGLSEEIARYGTDYPLLSVHLGPLALPLGMFARRRPTQGTPYPNPLLIAQACTDLCLRNRLEELGGQVEYGTRLASCKETSEGIVATVESGQRAEEVGARFLVGADGGASTVRKQIGVAFVGTTDESDRMIVADVSIDGLRRDRWHVWPRVQGRAVSLCPLPDAGCFQLIVKLRAEEEIALDAASLDQLVAGLPGTQPHVRGVSWASLYRPNVRLAARYRSGGVFLAGDAAHVHTPAGAQGMNTGIQDAYNLGWKLDQVIAGAPEALLDTYEAERRPIAARVLGLSDEIYGRLGGRSLRALKRGNEERQLGLTYRGGPLALSDGTELGDLRAGDRVPDARYTDADGREGRLFEATRGPWFTLLATGDAAISGLAEVDWPLDGAALKTVQVPDAAAGVARPFGLKDAAQLLIRPDGYLAYLARDRWGEALSSAAAAMAPPVAAGA